MLKKLLLASLIITTLNSYSGVDIKNDSEELISGELFPIDYQKGQYHITKNFPGIIILKITAAASIEKIRNPKFIVDMPEGYSCLGACPRYQNRNKTSDNACGWEMEQMGVENIKKDGAKYVRHTIKLSEAVVKMLKSQAVDEKIYIKTIFDIPVKEQSNVYVKLSTDNWEGQEKTFTVVLLPELSIQDAKTNKFSVMTGLLTSLTVPNDEIRNAYIDYWKSMSNANPYTVVISYDWDRMQPDLRKLVCAQFNVLHMLYSKKGGTPMPLKDTPKKFFQDKTLADDKFKTPFLEISQDQAATGRFPANGSFPQEQFVLCPKYLATDMSYWNEYVGTSLKSSLAEISGMSGIVYDMEPFAMGICICENCRNDFKKHLQIDYLPSSEETQGKYAAQWFDFRVKQNAAIIKAFCECVKKCFPGTLAIVCTEPLSASGNTLAKWCGVDVRLSDKDADLFMNMPYCVGAKYYDDLEFNIKALKTPNFPLNDPAERLISYFSRYTPEKIKQNIVATAALGGKGFGFWPDDVLDGKYLVEIKNAYSLVAKAEDYYYSIRNNAAISLKPEIFFEITIVDDGQNITLKFPDCSDSLRWTVHEKDENYLVTIINYAPNEVIVNLSAADIKSNSYAARDLEGNGLFHKDKNTVLDSDGIRKGFMVNVPGNSLKAIEITKNDIKSTTDKAMAVYQDGMKLKFDSIRKSFLDDYNLKEVKCTDCEISWGALADQRVPLVKLSSGDFIIYVNTSKGAEIISWNDKQKVKDILLFKDRGFMGNLVLSDDTTGKGDYRFSLEKAFMDNGNPVAVFKYTVPPSEGANPEEGPLENLEVEKQITLQNKGKTINIKHVFTNKSKSKKDMRLGFRLKNFPRTAIRPGNGESLSELSKISFETSEGIETIKTGNPDADNIILQSDAKMPIEQRFLHIKPKPFKWINSPIKIDVQSGECKEHMEFTPDKNNSSGFYVWWSKSVYTIELLAKEKLLKYDESFSYEYSISR